jgi:hypothetical protein
MDFTPAKRQRVKQAEFGLSTLESTSPSARGTRLAPKPVSRLKYLPPKAAKKKKQAARKKSPTADEPAQGDLF